jgi:hypothetical protein
MCAGQYADDKNNAGYHKVAFESSIPVILNY